MHSVSNWTGFQGGWVELSMNIYEGKGSGL